MTSTPTDDDFLTSRITDAHRNTVQQLNQAGPRFKSVEAASKVEAFPGEVFTGFLLTDSRDAIRSTIRQPEHWEDLEALIMNPSLTEQDLFELAVLGVASDDNLEENDMLIDIVSNPNCGQDIVDWVADRAEEAGELAKAVRTHYDASNSPFQRWKRTTGPQ